jgi:hypothetical protein
MSDTEGDCRPAGSRQREECGIRIVEDASKKLILLILPQPPAVEVRSLLHMRGFCFSAEEGAWVRPLNLRGLTAARKIVERIAERTSRSPSAA